MSLANPFGPPPEIYGYQTLWHSIGNYMATLEQYERSLPFFDEAVAKCPNDKKTLIDRGKVRGKICLFKGALEDINKAIYLDPNDLVSLAERSHAVYLNCEFEDAMVQNYRLLPLRKKPDHFSMGIRKCSTAIENCLGKVAGCPLRDYFLIIRKLAWLETFNASRRIAFIAKNRKIKKVKKKRRTTSTKPNKLEGSTDGSSISEDPDLQMRDSVYSHKSEKFLVPPLQQIFNFSPLQKYTTNIENYMAETYLERMYLEKIFVKNLRKYPGVTCPNQGGVTKLKAIAKDCYDTVYNKQEVLRTRRPFYNVKYQQAKITGSLRERQLAELMLHQENTKKEADKTMIKLETALARRNITAVIELAEKLRLYCDSKSKRLLPDKQIYLNKIVTIVRDAFYMINRLNPEQPKWEQEKRILVALGQPISKAPSRDSIIESYQIPLLDFKQQIKLFENRLERTEDEYEMIWHYHELARYHMFTKRYDVARSFCMRSLMLAEKNQEFRWVVNVHVLHMRICMRQLNKNDAILEATKAIAVAKELHEHNLQQYLEKCIAVMTDIEFDDQSGLKQLQKRQAKILALMHNDKVKSEFSHLFHTMSALPASRRMSIIPGAKLKDKTVDKIPSRSKSVKSFASIAPTFDEETYSTTQTTKGANFVNLVQFHL